MRRPSASLQFLSAAATSTADSSAAMSYHPRYRGGRSQGRRGFSSDCPYNGGRGNPYVSGDSHFQSVRDANLGLRQGERGSFADNTGYRPPLNPRPPPFNQNHQLRQPTPYGQRHEYRQPRPSTQNQHFPPFDQYQGVRPQQQYRPRPPKPLDFRNWENAKTPPPPNCERFTVLSYNILADYLAINHRSKLYFHIPRYMLDWEWRKRNITFELGLWSSDIMCFQEVDRYQDLEEELKLRGYSGIWKMRTGAPVDGCAIFWRTSRLKLVHEECIEFNKLGLRDNVAQICVLELTGQNNIENAAVLPTSLINAKRIVVCNIHVLYNPKRGEIKLGQVRLLLEKAHAVSKIWNDAPVVLCGDFNCTPKSPLYNFIVEKKLDLFGLDRDKVSGQASAEIRALPHNSNNRLQSASDSIPPPLREDSREVAKNDSIPDFSIPDLQEKNNLDRAKEYLPLVNNSLTGCSSNPVLDVTDKSCTELQCDDNALYHEEVRTGQNCAINDSRDENESAKCILEDIFKEASNSSQIEDGFHVDHISNKVNECTAPIVTCPEELHSDITEGQYEEKADMPCGSNSLSSNEYSDTSVSTEKESKNSSDTILADSHFARFRIDPDVADSFTSSSSSSGISCQSSLPGCAESFSPGKSGNSSSHPITNYAKGSTSSKYDENTLQGSTDIDLVVDEKLKNVSHNELDGVTVGGETAEDDSTFLSALHDIEDSFPSELGQGARNLMVSESTEKFEPVPRSSLLEESSIEVEDDLLPELGSECFEIEKATYDPSLWTPAEIETATGRADCTLLEHSLDLRSTYADVEDFSGTRDVNGEPLVTSYNRCFMGTVDYIWRSEGLQTVRVLSPMPKHAMQWTPGFPTKKWGSDHIALAVELAIRPDQ